MSLSPPKLFEEQHRYADFSSGEFVLDEWLKRRALKNQQEGAARTYVVCAENDQVVGYFSLAVGAISHAQAVGKIKRNMPDPIPIMLLARLAVDLQWQGRGLGYSMLQNAALRTLHAADIAGIRAMVVHAISLDAKQFYQHFGFRESASEPMTLMVTLRDLKEAFLLSQDTKTPE